MSKGVVIFGVNNGKIDYIQLAIMCASFVKKNMPNTKVCLISDKESVEFRRDVHDVFDDVVFIPSKEQQFENSRRYRDTQYYGFDAQFKNESRSSVYELSPYDETLLIDSDLLICNDTLKHVWGNNEEIMINRNACDLFHNPLTNAEDRLNVYGIPMYWATIIYFRKGDKAKKLFDLVDHIKDNWDFYKLTYDFPGTLFRNDYAFSIAIHILNGLFEQSNFIVPLPDPVILSAFDTDQFLGITSPSKLHFFFQDRKETWKYLGVTTNGLNVHCMNKLSLINNMNEIMEMVK